MDENVKFWQPSGSIATRHGHADPLKGVNFPISNWPRTEHRSSSFNLN